MKIDRAKLVTALTLVQAGLAAKEQLEQSTSFAFQDGYVYTYNDEIAISHPVDFTLTGVASAKELLSLLNKLKDVEIDMDIIDGELQVKGGKFESSIRWNPEIVLPLDAIDPPEVWNPLPANFDEAVKFCLFSASKDMTKPALTCIHAFIDRVESSDGRRLTVRYFDEKTYFPEAILLPVNAAKDLVGFNSIEYAVKDGWIHFQTEHDTIFSCRTYLDLAFPAVHHLMELEGTEFTFPADMNEMVDRAAVFTKKKLKGDEKIKVSISESGLTILGQGQVGWFKETSEIEYTGKDKEFHINPEFLASILSHKGACIVGDDRLLFENPDFVHVIALVKG